MFVINGTPDPTSNRMCEDACELMPMLDKEMFLGYGIAIKEAFDSKDISGLIRYLKWIDGANQGLGLVGSRGYVYRVERIIYLLNGIDESKSYLIRWNLLPRTGGLRSVAMHCLGE